MWFFVWFKFQAQTSEQLTPLTVRVQKDAMLKTKNHSSKQNLNFVLSYGFSFWQTKRCKSVGGGGGEGLIYLLSLHSYIILAPLAAQKDVWVLSCIFLNNPFIAAPLSYLFGRKNWTRAREYNATMELSAQLNIFLNFCFSILLKMSLQSNIRASN